MLDNNANKEFIEKIISVRRVSKVVRAEEDLVLQHSL